MAQNMLDRSVPSKQRRYTVKRRMATYLGQGWGLVDTGFVELVAEPVLQLRAGGVALEQTLGDVGVMVTQDELGGLAYGFALTPTFAHGWLFHHDQAVTLLDEVVLGNPLARGRCLVGDALERVDEVLLLELEAVVRSNYICQLATYPLAVGCLFRLVESVHVLGHGLADLALDVRYVQGLCWWGFRRGECCCVVNLRHAQEHQQHEARGARHRRDRDRLERALALCTLILLLCSAATH